MVKYATEIEGRLAADTALPLPAPGRPVAAGLPPLADLAALPSVAAATPSLPQAALTPSTPAAAAVCTAPQSGGLSPFTQQPTPPHLLQRPSAFQPSAFQQPPFQQPNFQQPNVVQQQGVQQMPLPVGGQPAAEQQPWRSAAGTFQPQRRWRFQGPRGAPWRQPRVSRPVVGANGNASGSRAWQPRKVMFAAAAPVVQNAVAAPRVPSVPPTGSWYPCFFLRSDGS